MSHYRRDAHRHDTHHVEIRRGLEAVGYQVWDTSALGYGFPDLLVVSRSGTAVLLEIKTPGEGLTPAEKLFHAAYHAPLRIVHSLDEALQILWDIDNPY